MTRLYFVIIMNISIILLTACSPSPQSIQTAIAETQAALTPTPTYTPTFTPQPTSTRINQPILLTWTQIPKPTYILEQGFCAMTVGKISGNPTDHAGCGVDKRTQVQLAAYEEVTFTRNENTVEIEIYCSLYSLDGTYIMSALDTTGSGKVVCHP